MSASPCPACRGDWPRRDHLIRHGPIADLYLHDDQFFRGWCVLVLNRHATELYHLSDEERHGLIDEAARVAEGLARGFEAAKMNYELLGNQLPHVHWHLIPRRSDDVAPRDPVWTVRHERRTLEGEALARLLEEVRSAVGAGS